MEVEFAYLDYLFSRPARARAGLVLIPMGLINERSWELSLANHTGWFWFIWVFLAVYLIFFLVGYPVAVRIATGLSWSRAIAS